MPLPTVVIAQSDNGIAQRLANDLYLHFSRIIVTESALELRALLLRHEARVAVLDLELVNMEEIHKLARTFCNLAIVCTHRSPDERMWTAALSAGAVELCHPLDIHAILCALRG